VRSIGRCAPKTVVCDTRDFGIGPELNSRITFVLRAADSISTSHYSPGRDLAVPLCRCEARSAVYYTLAPNSFAPRRCCPSSAAWAWDFILMADRTSLPASDVDHRGIRHWRFGVAFVRCSCRSTSSSRRSTATPPGAETSRRSRAPRACRPLRRGPGDSDLGPSSRIVEINGSIPIQAPETRGALLSYRMVLRHFVIRATRERGVGVPSSRSLATTTREAKSVSAP
jgi:hypothetical protein